MPSLIYTSALEDAVSGAIDFTSDTFKALLVSSEYQPNKDVHTTRADVSAEIFAINYATGGAEVEVMVEKFLLGDRIEITLGGATWPTSTITAAGAVYYKSRGGQADGDELVAFIDFGANVASINGTFTLNPSIIRLQN